MITAIFFQINNTIIVRERSHDFLAYNIDSEIKGVNFCADPVLKSLTLLDYSEKKTFESITRANDMCGIQTSR